MQRHAYITIREIGIMQKPMASHVGAIVAKCNNSKAFACK